MVKKLQKMAARKAASAAGLLDSQLAQTVKDSAQQIWLAGLGAFSKAQGEGNKVFDTLMKEGLNIHRKTQSAAEEKLGGVAGRVSAMAGQVGSQANAQWDKLESIFEERTARALGRLGVPTAKDVAALSARVDALAKAVAALGAAPAATDKAPVRRRSAATASAKAASKSASKSASKTAGRSAKPATSRSRKPAAAGTSR
jgi:poly(hydroxyalkanoate) granule-associated protein